MAGNLSLSNDEMSVLMIADKGQYMLAIGRWAPTCASLTAKGLMKKEFLAGGDQYTITDEGRKAVNQQDDANFGALIEAGSRMGAAQKAARDYAETSAKALAACAIASSPMTKDTPETAARKWSPIILERALDIINNG